MSANNEQKEICITGIMLRTLENYIIVEIEIDGSWHQVIKEFANLDDLSSTISHTIEPSGMYEAIKRGYAL